MVEKMSKIMPENLPYPLIYGPNFPKISFQTKDGKRRFFSNTNKNLFLESYDFTPLGTFTLGQFLLRLGPWKYRGNCYLCREKNKFCPLFISKMSYDQQTDFAQVEELVEDVPKWEICISIKDLLQDMQSEAERKWYLGYLDVTYTWCRNTYDPWVKIAQKWNEYSFSNSGANRRSKLPNFEKRRKFDRVSNLMKKAFVAPAPIPQVWLNYIPPWEIKPGSSMEEHIQENPSRVDFLIINKGKLVVVEIDGPTHYGTFNKNLGRWIINEEKCARNLWIERSLRKQGCELHRFSSWEVMRCTSNFEEYDEYLARGGSEDEGKKMFWFFELISALEISIKQETFKVTEEYIKSYPGVNPGWRLSDSFEI